MKGCNYGRSRYIALCAHYDYIASTGEFFITKYSDLHISCVCVCLVAVAVAERAGEHSPCPKLAKPRAESL